MPPVTYTKTEQLVTQLFTTRDDRLSVVQHGNNHDGYEFYKYARSLATPTPLGQSRIRKPTSWKG